MTLESYIENLRSKPDHVKKRYAFWTSFGVSFVIFAFWLGSFSSWGSASSSAVATVVNKAGSPGQSLIAGVGSFFGDMKNMVFGAKKVKYTSVEIVPGN